MKHSLISKGYKAGGLFLLLALGWSVLCAQNRRLFGKVKRVKQRSYVALPKGPQRVDKGAGKGLFFVYEFDEDRRKVKEERFTETGVCRAKFVYKFHYDGQGNWKIRVKYIDNVPVLYEEREYVYYE